MDQKNTNLNKTIYTKFTLNPKSNVQKQTTNKILEDLSLSMNKHLKINNLNKNNNKINIYKLNKKEQTKNSSKKIKKMKNKVVIKIN